MDNKNMRIVEDDVEIEDALNGAVDSSSPELTEEERRKAHEESEAKRKAEWEAKRQARIDAENAEWESATNMDANSLIDKSVKRLGDDAERITRRNFKQCLTEYVQVQCYEDAAFARQVMHPRKSMIRCFSYIQRMAFDFIKQEMKDNGVDPTKEGYACDIPDDLCYAWALEYFYDMDAPEDKREDEEEFKPKPYVPTPTKKSAKPKVEKKKDVTPPKPEKQTETEQLSLFGMGA